MNAIQIKNITKTYKQKALDNVSLNFEFGKIYGLLGRNGAGKSTLINILSNRIFADDGEILIDDMPAIENMNIHEKIFCMSEMDLYDKNMKVKNLFKWTARFYDGFDIDKAYNFAKKFDLDINKKFINLSKGYQSIFKLCIALSMNLPYIVFDEPVLGLDANNRELFYDLLIKNYQESEHTVIIATHLIEEVANIIEDAVMIDSGKILINESVESLIDKSYSLSGLASEVDAYCMDKNVLGFDELDSYKIAYIMDKKSPIAEGSSLKIAPINLQKLFVKLTERGVSNE